jgi:hypothetical protein
MGRNMASASRRNQAGPGPPVRDNRPCHLYRSDRWFESRRKSGALIRAGQSPPRALFFSFLAPLQGWPGCRTSPCLTIVADGRILCLIGD